MHTTGHFPKMTKKLMLSPQKKIAKCATKHGTTLSAKEVTLENTTMHPSTTAYAHLPIHERLKALRERLEQPTALLALAFDVDPRSFNRWVAGTHNPPGAVRALLPLIEADPSILFNMLKTIL